MRLVVGGGVGGAVYMAISWLVNRDWLSSMWELLMVDRMKARFGGQMRRTGQCCHLSRDERRRQTTVDRMTRISER